MQVCTQNCIGCSKNKHRNDEDKKNLIKRLNRVEGQVRGISKMVEEEMVTPALQSEVVITADTKLIIIEHNLHVIKSADWVIDMGPEGGLKGGMVCAEGTPEDLAKKANTPTGEYLRRYL